MDYLSVCSGIESLSVAWRPIGWNPIGFAEVEPFPCYVLASHYGSPRPMFMPDPDAAGTLKDRKMRLANIKAVQRLPETSPNGVPNYGDITRFREWRGVRPFRLLAGGTPCQSFSVAGLRQGLADPRGNLMLTYLAIAAQYRPVWVVWENVPGVFSSDRGRAFGTLLRGLAELGYGYAWRVLDAQFVRVDGFARAVPQRRRRVFVVGYLGDWRRAAAVLFDAQSLRGDSAPRRTAGQGTAGTISARPQGSGGLGTDFDLSGGVVPALKGQGCGTERVGESRGQDPVVVQEITGAVTSKWSKQSSGPSGDEAQNLIAVSVAPALNAGGNFTGGDRPPGSTVDTSETLIAEVAPTLSAPGHGGSRFPGTDPDSAGTLVAFNIMPAGFSDNAAVAKQAEYAQSLTTLPQYPNRNQGGDVAVEPLQPFNITPSNSNEDYNARPAAYAQALTAASGSPPSARGGDVIVSKAAETLTRGAGTAGRRREDDANLVASTLQASGADAGPGGYGAGLPLWAEVSHTLRADGHDASEDGTGKGPPLVVAFNARQATAVDDAGANGALDTHSHSTAIAFDMAQMTNKDNRSQPSDIAPAIAAGSDMHVAQAFDMRGREGGSQFEGPHDTAAMRAASGGSSRSYVAAPEPHGFGAWDSAVRSYDNVSPTVDAGKGEGTSVLTNYRVRRLMPIECERLQGYPEILKTVYVRCFGDPPQPPAPAAKKNRKSRSSASNAEGSVSRPHAAPAETNSGTSHQGDGWLAVPHVLIDLERREALISKAGKLLWRASIAVQSEGTPLTGHIESFAHAAALIARDGEPVITHGKAESLLSISDSLHHQNGNRFADASGQEIEQLAADAGSIIKELDRCTKFITSAHGQSSPDYASHFQTLCSCVAAATGLFIQEPTSALISSGLSVSLRYGYTNISYRGKNTTPDGPRYRAIGNGIAVNAARWLGRRIQMVEDFEG